MFKINNLNVSVNDKNILNDLNVELPVDKFMLLGVKTE